jgi:hypothetical protein
VGQVSGTTITAGSGYTFNADMGPSALIIDPHAANKFIVVYPHTGIGKSIVGTISGTTISFGTEVAFNSVSGSSYELSIAADPNTANKFVIAYKNSTSSGAGTALIGTRSGTSLSYGSATVYNAGDTTANSVDFSPSTANQFLVSFKDTSNSGFITAIIGTISGNTITFGSKVSSNVTGIHYSGTMRYSPNNSGKFAMPYRYTDVGPTYKLKLLIGSVTGSTVSFDSDILLNNVNSAPYALGFDSSNPLNFIVGARDYVNSSGYSLLGVLANSTTNLTSTNFIGIPDAAYADTTTATITLPSGLSTNQTGLTVGATYYVQTDGTLDTTADSPSVIAGKALSATSILLKSY